MSAWEDDDAEVDRSDWPHWAPAFLEAMERTPSISGGARAIEKPRSTIQRLMHRSPTFAAAVEEARQEGLDLLEEMAQTRALHGQQITKTVVTKFPDGREQTVITTESHISDTLLMFYLKAWRPMYRDSFRVEQTGKDGGPIEFEERLRDVDERLRSRFLRLVDGGTAGDAAS